MKQRLVAVLPTSTKHHGNRVHLFPFAVAVCMSCHGRFSKALTGSRYAATAVWKRQWWLSIRTAPPFQGSPDSALGPAAFSQAAGSGRCSQRPPEGEPAPRRRGSRHCPGKQNPASSKEGKTEAGERPRSSFHFEHLYPNALSCECCRCGAVTGPAIHSRRCKGTRHFIACCPKSRVCRWCD